MKLFANYLKKNVPIFLWTVCFLGMFVLVCFLYGVPVQPAFYTAQVSVVFGILALTVGFSVFAENGRNLPKRRRTSSIRRNCQRQRLLLKKNTRKLWRN